jgi:hypothetical protein
MSSDIIESKIFLVNWNVCNAGVLNPTLNVPINNMSFQPDMYRIELITCSNNNVNDNLFVISSNLSEFQPLVSYSGRTTFGINLSQQGVMSQPMLQLSFQLQLLAPDSNGNIVYTAPINSTAGGLGQTNNYYPTIAGVPDPLRTTAYVSMSLSFFKLKSGKKNTFTV